MKLEEFLPMSRNMRRVGDGYSGRCAEHASALREAA